MGVGISMEITRIVLTGGPCAGKSTGLAVIERKLKDLGYKVVIMSEMATDVINSGLHPMDIGVDFQDILIENQLARDKAYERMLLKNKDKYDKVVILYDRGIMDGRAYCSKEEFAKLLGMHNIRETQIMTFYDGVFHLVTAADGAPGAYTTENNKARMETAEEAVLADRRTLNCWVGHPHLRIITNNGVNFEQKMTKLMGEIMSLLGEPIPLEIERKYLIEMPDIEKLSNIIKLTKHEIIQTYLNSDEGVERRVRQRGTSGDYSYYYTEKRVVDETKNVREEVERKITQNEYIRLLMESDTTKHQIRKDRYCFVYNDRYFELDIYPFWNDKAILEIEVANADERVCIPEFIRIIKEVTDDSSYKNANLAKP